jgi:hypothetical protein
MADLKVYYINWKNKRRILAVNDKGHAQLLNAGQPGPNYHTLAMIFPIAIGRKLQLNFLMEAAKHSH